MSESDPPGLGVILVVEDDEGVRTLTGRMPRSSTTNTVSTITGKLYSLDSTVSSVL